MNTNPCAHGHCGADACRQGREPCPHAARRIAELRDNRVPLAEPLDDEDDFDAPLDWWGVVAAAAIVALTIIASHFYPWGFH